MVVLDGSFSAGRWLRPARESFRMEVTHGKSGLVYRPRSCDLNCDSVTKLVIV